MRCAETGYATVYDNALLRGFSLIFYLSEISHPQTGPQWHCPQRGDGGPRASHWAGLLLPGWGREDWERQREGGERWLAWSWGGLALGHCQHWLTLLCYTASLYQDQGELNTTLRGRNIPQTSVVSDTTSQNEANISPNIKYCPTLPGAGITRLSGNLKTHKVWNWPLHIGLVTEIRRVRQETPDNQCNVLLQSSL